MYQMGIADFSEQEMIQMMEDYPYCICISDTKSKRLVYCNQTARRLLGYTGEAHPDGGYSREACADVEVEYGADGSVRKIGTYVVVQEHLVYWDGQPCRLEMLADSTDSEVMRQIANNKNELEKAVFSCIESLSDDHESGRDAGMIETLGTIGTYYQAMCDYVAEFEPGSCDVIREYSWYRDDTIVRHEAVLGHMEVVESIYHWISSERKPCLVLDMDQVKEISPGLHGYFQRRGVTRFLMVPFLNENGVWGFMCIQNPLVDIKRLLMLRVFSLLAADRLYKFRLKDNLQYDMYYDRMTQLPNRNSFHIRQATLEQQEDESLGLVLANINGMGVINRDFGEGKGDEVIRAVAGTLRRKFFDDLVYRMAGDEFVILIRNIEFSELPKRVTAAEIELEPHAPYGVSLGLDWVGDGPKNLNQMLHNATQDMMRIKQRHYEKLGLQMSRRDNHVYMTLMEHMDRNDFVIYMQPKIYIDTGELCGMEALVRYRTPETGLVLPGKFVPMLEKERLIPYLDYYVFEQTCTIIRRWLDEGYHIQPVSVNFSRFTIVEEHFVDWLSDTAAKYGVDPKYILVEITETAGEMEYDLWKSLGERLQARGFGISMDDFCSKYSYLPLLSALTYQEVKFDRSMVEHIVDDRKMRTICCSVMAVCDELGHGVLAEGVETADQMEVLRNSRCQMVQGYYVARPMPAEEFERRYYMS